MKYNIGSCVHQSIQSPSHSHRCVFVYVFVYICKISRLYVKNESSNFDVEFEIKSKSFGRETFIDTIGGKFSSLTSRPTLSEKLLRSTLSAIRTAEPYAPGLYRWLNGQIRIKLLFFFSGTLLLSLSGAHLIYLSACSCWQHLTTNI